MGTMIFIYIIPHMKTISNSYLHLPYNIGGNICIQMTSDSSSTKTTVES